MIASLAWYPAARTGWDSLWRGIREDLGFGPSDLTWPDDFARHWRDPDLLLAMTCALPMQQGLADSVHVVGSPVWDVPGLPPGQYASHIVTRPDDTRALADVAADGLAVNGCDSQSGYGTLVTAGLVMGPGDVVETGSHAASMDAVASGAAGLAAIDVVTWALAPRSDLSIRATTPPTPACPFITARADWVAPLRQAITRAIARQSPRDRAATRLVGLTSLDPEAYATCRNAPHCNREDSAA
ncbi:phosphate ABC transporter substrate-binding protein [Jannaschia pagri]|uniref:Phosphate ABC transporter substrate-binding protein n=1 Tax=Jannaschia pagri TaxID=2829797 RepID=A0ABQ4NI40_9RHOB|nr:MULTISPECIES: PhnD/SsuA/transferrin family substrate-binding protein [unclassified Jannaschia]GIT90040.1 phosphate ABC transporter substrate-binding protein [Jannaschia sp. AI_61]GIT93854.1 phosphate ABC transporter substrate-binding protein [Jannaschia sp. AI_62]